MSYRQPARLQIRWIRVTVLLIALAAFAVVLGDRLPGSSSSTATSMSTPAAPMGVLRGDPGELPRQRGVLGEVDGAIPDGTTVFDDQVPGVARVQPALLDALRAAAADAAGDGVDFVVDSGWRSRAYQAQLLRDAVARYGSAAEAARWVARPGVSEHVSGGAVDLGSDAARWLSERGAAYGLCQIYANESWHYELRPDAPAHGCPALYADPTHDPRTQA